MREIIIDIGCGDYKSHPAAYGIDKRVASGVNILCDIEKGIGIRDNSADRVISRHTLEHIIDLEQVLTEILRITKPGGVIEIIVPHFSNSLAYSDYTHKRFFGLYTFDYFSLEKCRYWETPTYHPSIRLKILKKRLIFRNIPVLRFLFNNLFNRSEWLSYLYERQLSWVLSCYEIQFELMKI